ncbi:hypothetical protein WICPIJ_000600 [Wickerhamomyces pijperi]|uniref:Uncharacterized protein n=1 Tax=Wickerhamomyces pijperi TaxID=599730 RepID=A0A9P8TSE3_WICPI|nr:hypothetical protein WICPIJ_000600 [Wickerhamomyces pijperi]
MQRPAHLRNKAYKKLPRVFRYPILMIIAYLALQTAFKVFKISSNDHQLLTTMIFSSTTAVALSNIVTSIKTSSVNLMHEQQQQHKDNIDRMIPADVVQNLITDQRNVDNIQSFMQNMIQNSIINNDDNNGVEDHIMNSGPKITVPVRINQDQGIS